MLSIFGGLLCKANLFSIAITHAILTACYSTVADTLLCRVGSWNYLKPRGVSHHELRSVHVCNQLKQSFTFDTAANSLKTQRSVSWLFWHYIVTMARGKILLSRVKLCDRYKRVKIPEYTLFNSLRNNEIFNAVLLAICNTAFYQVLYKSARWLWNNF